MSTTYTLLSFKSVWNSHPHYELSSETINKIRGLSFEITPLQQPVIKPKQIIKKIHHKVGPIEIKNDDDWNAIKSFQLSKIEVKYGLQAEIDKLRGLINKLTDKNQQDIIPQILSQLEQITHDPDFKEDKTKEIIQMISSNQHYVQPFTTLFVKILETYHELFWIPFQQCFESFSNSFSQLTYVDPQVNYDLYCDTNKQIIMRKAYATFYSQLSTLGVIEINIIQNLIQTLINQFNKNLNDAHKRIENDELIDILSILYTNDTKTEEISNFFEELCFATAKSFPGLSSKAIFKCVEIMERL